MSNCADTLQIEAVTPEVDSGRFPVKRTVGEKVVVEADIFTDGHDAVSAVVRYRAQASPRWTEVPMEPLANDRWRAAFLVKETGRYHYSFTAWVDKFKTWRQGIQKKWEDHQDVSVDLVIGAGLVEEAGEKASGPDARTLRELATSICSAQLPQSARVEQLLNEQLSEVMDRYPDRRYATSSQSR